MTVPDLQAAEIVDFEPAGEAAESQRRPGGPRPRRNRATHPATDNASAEPGAAGPMPVTDSAAEETEPDVTEALARLGALSTVDYERCRTEEAKGLGMRVSALDKLVERERERVETTAEDGPRSPVADLEPWPEPVNGATLLTELQSTILRFMVMSEEAACTAALWIIHSHAIDAADVTPYLAITSPERECGKSTLLGILKRTTRRAILAASITRAAVYRTIEAHSPTLLIDEADTFLRDNEELRGVLNSGHSRDTAQVWVTEETRKEGHQPRAFSTWAPKAIALIGALPDTLASRSIEIRLARKLPGERTEDLRQRTDPETFKRLARQATRWAADNLDGLRVSRPAMPGGIHGRRADNWDALLAIADLAGGIWPGAAREAAVNLSRSASVSESLGTRLLRDLRGIVAGKAGCIPTSELIDKLTAIEEAPWSEVCKGKPITPRKVAGLLKPFGIAPVTFRDGNSTPKGYAVADLDKVFIRYLGGSEPQHPQQTHDQGLSGDSRSATGGGMLRMQFESESAQQADVAGVADGRGGWPEEEYVSDETEILI